MLGQSSDHLSATTSTTGASGDASAMAEILAYQTACTLTQFQGISASGSVSLPGGVTVSEAKLWISNTGAQRLDIPAPDGLRSTRISEGSGISLTSGKPDLVFDQDLAFAGLVQLPALLPTLFKDLAVTAKEGGMISDTVGLVHKIALLVPNDPKVPSLSHRDHSVQLFFDPTTHLLKKSVAMVHLFGPIDNLVELTTTYGDYRLVGLSLTPFQVAETIDGQPYWTLRLTTAAVLDKQDTTLF